MSTLDLTGLPVNDALSLARHRLDREFTFEMAELESDLIRDGLNRDYIAGIVAHERAGFAAWRREHLDELRDWLVECNRCLH